MINGGGFTRAPNRYTFPPTKFLYFSLEQNYKTLVAFIAEINLTGLRFAVSQSLTYVYPL
jgi:hypothetical protein